MGLEFDYVTLVGLQLTHEVDQVGLILTDILDVCLSLLDPGIVLDLLLLLCLFLGPERNGAKYLLSAL